MKIMSWNVNGLRSAIRQGFMEWLEAERPDLLCLQEVKASSDQLPMAEFTRLGYHSYISSAEKKGYSGTLILSRQAAKATNYHLGLPRFDREGRMVELAFESFSLINCYLPHGGRQKENLDYKMEVYSQMIEYCSGRSNLIVVGDFNIARAEIDVARAKQNRNNIMFTEGEREILDQLIKAGFIDSFRYLHPEIAGAYTWWPYMAQARERNIGWRIDYVLVPDALKSGIIQSEIKSSVYGSDHCPVQTIINLEKLKCP